MKAVIFDLDNTLMNFWKLREMSKEAALDAMHDTGLRINRKRASRIFHELETKYGTEYGEIYQEFVKKVTGKIDWKILANAITAYRKMRNSFLEPYPGVISTLIKLKERGIKLGIVSDAPRMRGWLRLTAMKLEPFFDTVVFFEDTKKFKPRKEPFMKALKELGVKPEDAIMVGDHLKRDIVGAKKVGMKSCHARYGHIEGWSGKKVRGFSPDFQIDDIRDILSIIQ